MVYQFCSVRVFNQNRRSKNFVLRNTILVYDMPIVFPKDLVKQFLVAGLSNQYAVIWIYFRQLIAMTHEEEELEKNVKDLCCQIESGKNGNWEIAGFKKDQLRPCVASPVMK
jgi:hypothetical protein